MDFHSMLLQIDGQLSRKDLEHLVFLCEAHLKTQQDFKSSHELFEVLEKKGLISEKNVQLLNSLFKIIGRMDLLEMLPDDGVMENDGSGEQMTSVDEYVCPFSRLLFDISEELPQEEVKKMRYAYGRVPGNVEISSGIELFKIMKKQKALSQDNLEKLKHLLGTIDRNDLVSDIEDFLCKPSNSSAPSLSCGAGDSTHAKKSTYQSNQSMNPISKSEARLFVQQEQQSRNERAAEFPQSMEPCKDVGTAQEFIGKSSFPSARSLSVPSGTPYTQSASPELPQMNFPSHENYTASAGEAAQVTEEIVQTDISDEKYKMASEPRGICLVIDNDKFETHTGTENLMPRRGSHVDAESLKECFEMLKFEVEMQKNLTLSQTRDCLERLSRLNHGSSDCFVCCVLSHGAEGAIYCSDCLKMEVKELTSYFSPKCCPSLGGKPKLFFLSCCQGKTKPDAIFHPEAGQIERDGPSTETDQISSEVADFLIGYATMFGYASFRDIFKGTIYIQILTDILKTHYKKKHLLDMLVMVNAEISKKTLSVEGKDYKQVGAPQMTLTKQVWF